MSSEKVTTVVYCTFDELPENHPLHDFDGSFWVRAAIYPGCRATYDSPEEPTEFEIVEAQVLTPRDLGCERNEELSAAFLDYANEDHNLRTSIWEQIGEEAQPDDRW